MKLHAAAFEPADSLTPSILFFEVIKTFHYPTLGEKLFVLRYDKLSRLGFWRSDMLIHDPTVARRLISGSGLRD